MQGLEGADISKLWKNAALVCGGFVLFAAAFAGSPAAVRVAASVGTATGLGMLGIVGAQVIAAGLLGAIGGASLGVAKAGIKAICGGLRNARFHAVTVEDAMRQADAESRRERRAETKHALIVGFLAGAGLAGLAAFFPTWVLLLLRGAVIFGLGFELIKALANSVALALEHRRMGRALVSGDIEAAKRRRWERDEEVEEIILNLLNAAVLGVLWHSLHAIDEHAVSQINVGVSQSADEVAALYESVVEIGEVAGAIASEVREVEKAGGWLARLRAVWSGTVASAPR